MIRKIVRYVAIGLVVMVVVPLVMVAIPFLMPSMEVSAAPSANIIVTAVPDWTSPFAITKISDTQVDVDWTIPVGADRVMVRAKYASYPADPGGGVEPTDGYLVYFGNGVAASDTSMNLDESVGKLYYRAWSITPTPGDVWSASFGEDNVEGLGMTMLVFALLPLSLTYLMFTTKNRMLGFACAIFWAIFGGLCYQESAATWDLYYMLFFASAFGMVILTIIAQFGLREKRDSIGDVEMEKGEGGYIDEGKKVKQLSEGDDNYMMEEEVVTESRRTRALHARADARRNRGASNLQRRIDAIKGRRG